MPHRREILRWSLAGFAALALPAHAGGARAERRLALANLHTGERLSAVYWAEGGYQEDEIAAIEWLLRDHRNDEQCALDRRLFDVLYALQAQGNARAAYEVISGYRSAATNARLAERGGGVARDSLHVQGRAVDVRLAGVALPQMQRAAIALRAGGVGYYPVSNFLHLDTGRVRIWQQAGTPAG